MNVVTTIDNGVFYQLSSYFKKHILMDIQQYFLPKRFVKFDGMLLSLIYKPAKSIPLRKSVPTGAQI